jgi:hypothetical protein
MAKYEEKKKKSQPVSFYPPKPVYEELRKLAFNERESMNALILEAVDLLFNKRGSVRAAGLNPILDSFSVGCQQGLCSPLQWSAWPRSPLR